MKVALGTVQFGMAYGITNSAGIVDKVEVAKILSVCKDQGISVLDTAAAYGKSESVLGGVGVAKKFEVVTKIPSLVSQRSTIESMVDSSLIRLGLDRLYGLLFHDENDLNDERFGRVCKLKTDGKVDRVGASFYSPEALARALREYDLDIIQIPASCLDQRFESSGLLKEAKSRGIEVHARSLFLQGLLLDERARLPEKIQSYSDDIFKFFKMARSLSIRPIQLCLVYLRECPFIDYGVVGCTSAHQLCEITAAYNSLADVNKSFDLVSLASTEEDLLNPSRWY